MILQMIGNVLLLFAFLPFAIYIVMFAARSPNWYKSEMGVHLMVFNAVIAAILGLSLIRLVAGASLDILWFQILRLVVFVGIPIVGFKQLQLLIKAQREERQILEGKFREGIQEEGKEESVLEMSVSSDKQRQENQMPNMRNREVLSEDNN